MATRANPFYRYQNPNLGMAFSGLAEALFPQAEPQAAPADTMAREAQAAANFALAAERGENTRGKQIRNDRYAASPTDLAALFLSGGRLQDEELVLNPLSQAPAPIDWSNTNVLLDGIPQRDTQPMFLGGRSAVDQMAGALQMMEAYGFRPDQIMDAIGQLQFLQRAGGDDPQSALPFAPFAGITNPNPNTALSAADQDRISGRNADEALTQATTVEGMRNRNRLEVANLQEAGRDRRAADSPTSTRTPTLPTLTPSTAASMRQSLEQRLRQLGHRRPSPEVLDEMTALAARLFQDPSSDAFKNVAVAVQEATEMLEMGMVPTISEQLKEGWFGRTSSTLTRIPPSERSAAPQPAAPASATRPDPSQVQGLPAGARIGNQRTPQGWEVLDRNGRLIGHIQE